MVTPPSRDGRGAVRPARLDLLMAGVEVAGETERPDVNTRECEQRLDASLGTEPTVPLEAAGRQRSHVIHELRLRECDGVASNQAQAPYSGKGERRGRTVLRVVRHGGGT